MRTLTSSSRSVVVVAAIAIGLQLGSVATARAQAAAPFAAAPVPAVDPVGAALAEASRRFGVLEHWIGAVMRQESNGDVRAVSATALDKDVAKRLLSAAGLAVARSVTILPGAVPSFEDIEQTLGLPVFLKPARQGSSVGVAKVAGEVDYRVAVAGGFRHDNKLLAEEFVQGREIECSVLEEADDSLFVSRLGEVVPADAHGFYSYEAKYVDPDGAALQVPADLPAAVETRMRTMAEQAFRALGCDAMARVDFFVTADMRVLVNELNTIPGFTDISMYAKAMAASGVPYTEVIGRLVAQGLARHQRAV